MFATALMALRAIVCLLIPLRRPAPTRFLPRDMEGILIDRRQISNDACNFSAPDGVAIRDSFEGLRGDYLNLVALFLLSAPLTVGW